MAATALAVLGTIKAPLQTFAGFDRDRHAAIHGALVLLFVSIVYTLILAEFISRGYSAVSSSALGLPVQEQYRWQIWYQGPLFFATTGLTAAVLVVIARAAGRKASLGVAFARLSFATAVPFALTTMLVESVVSVLMASGILAPNTLLNWITGSGAVFAGFYQVAALVWLIALVAVAARTTVAFRWWSSILTALLLVLVYILPIGLLIR